MTADLERRYARLLRLYPAEYRRSRGAELLETLLESAEAGRKRPARREVAALVVGALRVHAGRQHRESVRQSWLAAFRAGALMLLAYSIANAVLLISLDVDYGTRWPKLVSVALSLCALVAVLRNSYRTAIAVALLSFAVALTASLPTHTASFGDVWRLPLAVVLLAPLLKWRPLPAAGLLKYAPAVPLVLVVAQQSLSQAFPEVSGILERGVLAALWAGALLWLAVDERVAMALGLLLLNDLLIQVGFLATGSFTPNPWAVALSIAVTAVGPATLLLSSAATARRQASH